MLFISAPFQWAKCVLLTPRSSFCYQGLWPFVSSLDPKTKWKEDNSGFLGSAPSHLCKSQCLPDSPSEVSRPYVIVSCPGLPYPGSAKILEQSRREEELLYHRASLQILPLLLLSEFFAQTISMALD